MTAKELENIQDTLIANARYLRELHSDYLNRKLYSYVKVVANAAKELDVGIERLDREIGEARRKER